MNENQIRVYDSTGATPITDPDGLLQRVQDIRFSTIYPGGIFETASFFIPCDVTRYIPIKHNNRLIIRNGLSTVWEGFVTDLALMVSTETQGLTVTATGYWALAFTRYKYNRWIDRRFTSNIKGTWYPLLDPANKMAYDQTDQILLTPKQVDFNDAETNYIEYDTNGSSNIKRIVFSYELKTHAETSPIRIKKYTAAGGTYSANMTYLEDGRLDTSNTISFAAGDQLLVGLSDPANVTGLRFCFGGTVNANAATLAVYYWGVDAAWHSIAITDGTLVGGACLAKDGIVYLSAVEGWDTITINGSQKFYYLLIAPSAALTANIIITEIYVQRGEAWTLFLNDQRHGTNLWSGTVEGTGSVDIPLGTSTDQITFGITSNAQQKVVGSGIYGKITNLALVAESWSGSAHTTVRDLLTDCVHHLAAPFTDDYTYIGPNSYDMLTTGFVEDALDMSLAQQMQHIGTFSASAVAYSVGVIESDSVPGAAGPVVYYEQQPILSDYDFAVRLDEANLSGLELVTSSGTDVLYNEAYVRFTTDGDKADWANYIDDAGLHDTTSQTNYYQRVLIVDGKQAATPALGAKFGVPYVAQKKALQYYMRSPLVLTGTIRTKAGVSVPVSQIRAGKRIKIENFLTDINDLGGLIFLITRTDYDDVAQTCSVTCGQSDNLAQMIARQAVMGK